MENAKYAAIAAALFLLGILLGLLIGRSDRSSQPVVTTGNVYVVPATFDEHDIARVIAELKAGRRAQGFVLADPLETGEEPATHPGSLPSGSEPTQR